MYLTYTEYQNYGGSLDETTFNYLEYEAESYVNWYTFNRLKGESIPDEVKKCMYFILKLIQNKMDLLGASPNGSSSTSVTGAGIASQSNDGVSISYNVLSAKEMIESSQEEIEDSMNRYLQGVRNSLGHRLLFRGIYPDEVVK